MSEQDPTEGWVRIPHKPGDPQPRIADGVYRGIRSDGRGGYEGLPGDAPRLTTVADLAEILSRVDLAIFYYPRELKTAGRVRDGLAEMIRELKGHTDAD